MNIVEVKFKCEKCGKEQVYRNIDTVNADYNQYVIDIYDQEEDNFDGHCKCEREWA